MNATTRPNISLFCIIPLCILGDSDLVKIVSRVSARPKYTTFAKVVVYRPVESKIIARMASAPLRRTLSTGARICGAVNNRWIDLGGCEYRGVLAELGLVGCSSGGTR